MIECDVNLNNRDDAPESIGLVPYYSDNDHDHPHTDRTDPHHHTHFETAEYERQELCR